MKHIVEFWQWHDLDQTNFVFYTVGFYTTEKMMQCFHFMVEPAKTITAKIKVLSTNNASLLFK